MCYIGALVVFRIQYYFFLLSARCIRIWSAQRFFLCSLLQYICFSPVYKFFRVSGLGISARARGNFMHNNILRHTLNSLP
jgi:hypothetical protein